jgi:hypothetical protein
VCLPVILTVPLYSRDFQRRIALHHTPVLSKLRVRTNEFQKAALTDLHRSQIRVTGAGTKYPSSDQLMTMQEIYEGASWPNIFLSTDLESFVVPGPPPVTLDGNSSPPPASVSRSRASSRATPTGTATQLPSSTNLPMAQKCFLASPKRRLVRRR